MRNAPPRSCVCRPITCWRWASRPVRPHSALPPDATRAQERAVTWREDVESRAGAPARRRTPGRHPVAGPSHRVVRRGARSWRRQRLTAGAWPGGAKPGGCAARRSGVVVGRRGRAAGRRPPRPRRPCRGRPGRPAGPRRRGWSGSRARCAPPASGCGAAGPRSWRGCGSRARSVRATISRCTRPANRSPTDGVRRRAASSRSSTSRRRAAVRCCRSRRRAARCTGRRRPVGEARPGRPRRARSSAPPAGQEGLHAGRDQPALDAGARSAAMIGLARSRVPTGAAIRPTVARVDDHDLAGQRAAAAPDRSRSRAWRCGCRPRRSRASRASALSVAGPQVPSGGMPMLRWNSRSACSVSRAEDAVDPAGVEAQVEQPLLQRGDVVAGEQVAGDVARAPGRRAASAPRRAAGRSAGRRCRRRSARAAAGTPGRRGRASSSKDVGVGGRQRVRADPAAARARPAAPGSRRRPGPVSPRR